MKISALKTNKLLSKHNFISIYFISIFCSYVLLYYAEIFRQLTFITNNRVPVDIFDFIDINLKIIVFHFFELDYVEKHKNLAHLHITRFPSQPVSRMAT